MKLSYRGNKYNQSPAAINAKVEKRFGKYRGQDIQITHFEDLPTKHISSNRTYRGISYS